MSNKLGLTEEEEKKINTVCEYLFFDQFTEASSYKRFERCFQPLFSEESKLELDDIFQELCGPKKKYLNYKRFVNSYLKYKENKVSEELKLFFDKLFNSILQDNSVGSLEQGCFTYSTVRSNRNRECITLIEVLNDREGIIHGINIQYDNIFKNKLYPKKIEENLSVGLEISLKILDEDIFEKEGISKYIKASYFTDAVTHIFGTIDQESKNISFLGFKCISGKTQFIGSPKGKSFLIGDFGKKFKQLKCQMTLDGIKYLNPYFERNYRTNSYLSKKISELTLEDLSKDEILFDESYLTKLNDKEEIEKFITTTFVDESHFLNSKLKDDICGNSLKEVIKKKPKKWMVKKEEKKDEKPKKLITLNEFMKIFEEEQKRRGRFYREGGMRFPRYNPKFGLLSKKRRHRRRRLRPFGFGYEGFSHSSFPGNFGHSNFSPFTYHYPFNNYRFEKIIMNPFSRSPGLRTSSFYHSFSPQKRNFNFFKREKYGYPSLGDYDYIKNSKTLNYGNDIYYYKDTGFNRRQGDYYPGQYYDNNNIVLRGKTNKENIKKTSMKNITSLIEKSDQQKNINEKKNENEEQKEKKDDNNEEIEDEDDDEDVLIPDEHPELTTSLEELDEQLESIKNLLQKKDLKEEEKKNLKN